MKSGEGEAYFGHSVLLIVANASKVGKGIERSLQMCRRNSGLNCHLQESILIELIAVSNELWGDGVVN